MLPAKNAWQSTVSCTSFHLLQGDDERVMSSSSSYDDDDFVLVVAPGGGRSKQFPSSIAMLPELSIIQIRFLYMLRDCNRTRRKPKGIPRLSKLLAIFFANSISALLIIFRLPILLFGLVPMLSLEARIGRIETDETACKELIRLLLLLKVHFLLPVPPNSRSGAKASTLPKPRSNSNAAVAVARVWFLFVESFIVSILD